MTGMIERVARAICGTDPWETHVDDARAAIWAMREPTDEMTNLGVNLAMRISLSEGYRWPDYIADLYRTMTDAALRPTDP